MLLLNTYNNSIWKWGKYNYYKYYKINVISFKIECVILKSLHYLLKNQKEMHC